MFSKTLASGFHNVVLMIFLFELAVCQGSFAQLNGASANKTSTDSLSGKTLENLDLLGVELPPLQQFLDAAFNAPSVEMYRSMKKEQENRLNLIKNEWFNYLRGVGNYSYGSMGSMTEASATGQSTYFQYYGQTMSLYNVGASLTLPLDLFFNRKSKINIQESQIEQANFRLLQAIEDRKILIIENYSIAVKNLELLRVSQEAVSIANSSLKLGELEYINGKIDLSALNALKREQTLSISTNQEAKTALSVAILKLELLTNLKIIK
jgi:outer membrane protein TolC